MDLISFAKQLAAGNPLVTTAIVSLGIAASIINIVVAVVVVRRNLVQRRLLKLDVELRRRDLAASESQIKVPTRNEIAKYGVSPRKIDRALIVIVGVQVTLIALALTTRSRTGGHQVALLPEEPAQLEVMLGPERLTKVTITSRESLWLSLPPMGGLEEAGPYQNAGVRLLDANGRVVAKVAIDAHSLKGGTDLVLLSSVSWEAGVYRVEILDPAGSKIHDFPLKLVVEMNVSAD